MLPDSLLITGPVASGKSRAALHRFRAVSDSLLLTPSATMAEHVRNNLAREGGMFRPGRVMTLAQFLENATPDLQPAPKALIHRLIRQALERQRPLRFREVAQYRGFHEALLALMEEAPAESLEDDLAALFREVESALAARGLALRGKRLEAASRIAFEVPAQVVLDGFFSFSPPELALLRSIAGRAVVTVSLPDWPGAKKACEYLLQLGLVQERLTTPHRRPFERVFSASTLTREVEEIARLVLEEAGRGRPFREMGVILRQREPYAAALETTFARFAIPARFYFADPLSAHPAVAFLSGVVHAMLEGWDHAALLALLRVPVSGTGATPEGDRFDFALRQRLPGAGLPIRGLDPVPPLVDSLTALDGWRFDRLDAASWAARFKTLRALLPRPVIQDGVSRDQLMIWRSTTAALDGFEAAMDQTGQALELEGRISLADFWNQADLTLRLESLRVPDRRRNVVHVMDVFEARQWELPVVFVCGLTERHFPQYHREDPLLNDAERRRAGLKTSLDWQSEESFLFDLAISRATSATILSRPDFNDKGEEVLASFFLEGKQVAPCGEPIRPRAAYAVPRMSPPSIQDAGLLSRLAKAHKALAATSIESFLQCPFQFFAGKTLRLRERPPAPEDRMDMRLKGTILHRVLAELARMPLLGALVFDQVFDDECARRFIPATYRTEATRLELLRHFQAYLADRAVTLDWASRVEEKFSFALTPLLTITGRIDRLDIGPGNRALVIDYKYSAANKIREKIEEHEAGSLVQGGLYLMAAERQFGLEPAAMLYCGVRNQIAWDGWHVPIDGLERVGESRTPEGMRDLMNAAAKQGAEAFDAIASGRVAPQPADPSKCRWCDFKDMCRVV